MTTDAIRAAGGVVRRLDPDGTPRVLVVHRQHYDDWSFPKGKRHPGEPGKVTARREVGEEAGIHVRVETKLPEIRYIVEGVPKRVRYWLMAWTGDAPELRDDEVDEVRWCTIEEARVLLSYDDDLPLLDAIHPTTRPSTVWILRHAKAGSRFTYDGLDTDRPLTDAGHEQAAAIAARLTRKPIARIITSPYARCTQTVTPLGAALGLPLEIDAALGEGSTTAAIHRWCAEPDPLVLCTHGDVLEALVNELVVADVVPPEAFDHLAKGSIWRLRTVGGNIVRARYTADAAIDPPAL